MKKILLMCVMAGFAQLSAQLTTIDETFNDFEREFPQNGWERIATGTRVYVEQEDDIEETGKYVVMYSLMQRTQPGYLITPQIVAPDGTKTLTFDATRLAPAFKPNTIIDLQIGLVSGNTEADMDSFEPIGDTFHFTNLNDLTSQSVAIPASSKQYIAFKFVGNDQHTALKIDNIKYDVGDLGVENNTVKAGIRLALNASKSTLHFAGNTSKLQQVQIYSATGQKVADGAVVNNTMNVSSLPSGIYFVLVKTSNGSVEKLKFIK